MLLIYEDIKMTLDIYTRINKNNKEDTVKSIIELNIQIFIFYSSNS